MQHGVKQPTADVIYVSTANQVTAFIHHWGLDVKERNDANWCSSTRNF